MSDNQSATPEGQALLQRTIDAKTDLKLSNEAAKWRVQTREREKEIVILKKRVAELEAGSVTPPPGQSDPPADDGTESDGSPGSSPRIEKPDLDGGEDLSDLIALRDDLAGRALLRELEAAGARFPDDAAAQLRGRGQLVIGDDGSHALVIDGQTQPISRGGIEKILRPEFVAAQGVAGTGSKGGRPTVSSSVDYQRGLNDSGYYNANRAAMESEFKKRNS